MKINNFDVIKRMSEENMDIRIAQDVLDMKAGKQGTRVTVGVPGNVIAEIFSGDTRAFLMMYNVKQFNELKSKMEQEAADSVD